MNGPGQNWISTAKRWRQGIGVFFAQ